MQDYKIVASDLDGTFLNRDGLVSEENWEAVRAMTACGVHFVPCTGRTLHEMSSEIRDNPAVRYIIHSGGSVVYDKQTDERIEMCMPKEIGHQLLDILNLYPHLKSVRYDRNVYIAAEQKSDEVFDSFHVGNYSKYKVLPMGIPMENFESFCREMNGIETIGIFFKNEEDRTDCIERLEQTGNFLIVKWSGLVYIEVCYKTAGKGSALLALARRLGYDDAQTIGVGDSTNDLTMIRDAGLGIAVSNACDLLKEEADEIICSNEEHAIKYIFEHYISKQN